MTHRIVVKNGFSNQKKYRLILSAVHMVYRLVNSTYNVKEMALRLTRLLCQFVKAKSASVYLLDLEKKKISSIAVFDNKINMYIDRKKDITANVTAKDKMVAQGNVVFEKHLLGIPLVSDDNLGALIVRRSSGDPAFSEFDRDMLSVFAEQAVTAIKNLQFYEQQQSIILGSLKLIKKLVERHGHLFHTPVYFKITKCLAEKMNMNQEGISSLHYASILHDAGALEVPYDILSKTSQLTPDEFKIIQDQPTKSVELIKPVAFLKPVLPIILYHHEKYDGTGYPSGLKKEQIPLGARIMSVVDAFEAMLRGRPYREQLSVSEAIAELRKNRGTQFDPKVVDAFCALSRQKGFRKYLNLIKS